MCCSCGCVLSGTGRPDDDHGDPRQITLTDLMAAAEANGVPPMDVVAMLGATLAAISPDDDDVAKAGEPAQQFVLGVAYQAGPDPKIAKGLDGKRDYFEPAELEKACWSFMTSGQQSGLFHLDGTLGHATPVENYIYRNPVPWIVAPDLIVRKGDWQQGYLLDDVAWPLVKDGKATGLSPQGVGVRRSASERRPAR